MNLHFADGARKYSWFGDDNELEQILESFSKHLSIAKSIDRFSANPTNRFVKSYMLQVIKEMYEV
jgi:hypothetical protein